jgi:putative hydrolase of HD superfamily
MEELLELYLDVQELKHTEREGWKDIGVDRPRDTIASHSFGTALLGWILAEREGLDSDRIVKMLLLHDLIMSYLEDITPDDAEYAEKREIENRMSARLLADVPEEISSEFEELFEEFQQGETELARFARECDKLETLLQAYCYSKEREEDDLSEFLASYEEYFSSETGRALFEGLKDADV